jgi:galactokinase
LLKALSRPPQSPALLDATHGAHEQTPANTSTRLASLQHAHEVMKAFDVMPAQRAALLILEPLRAVEQRRALQQRAQHASWSDFAQLFERSEQRERIEFCASCNDQAAQSSRP